MADPTDPRRPGATPPNVSQTPGPTPGQAPPQPPPVQQINVRTEAPAPARSGGGATAAIVGIVALLALLAVVYFVFVNGGQGEVPGTDVEINLPEIEAPEAPDVNIEVPDIEVPDIEVPDEIRIETGDGE